MKSLRLSHASLGVALVGALALTACPPKDSPPAAKPGATKPMAPAPAAPAQSQPATAPTGTPGAPGTPGQPGLPGTPPAATPGQGALDKGTKPSSRDQVDPDGVIRRGVALSGEKTRPVGELVGVAGTLTGKPVKVAGIVGRVCEKSGCWMTIHGDDPEQSIRITAKDYKFFVPTTAIGKRAVIEGELSVKTLSQAEVDHLAADGARPKSGNEIAISAVGLEVSTRS